MIKRCDDWREAVKKGYLLLPLFHFPTYTIIILVVVFLSLLIKLKWCHISHDDRLNSEAPVTLRVRAATFHLLHCKVSFISLSIPLHPLLCLSSSVLLDFSCIFFHSFFLYFIHWFLSYIFLSYFFSEILFPFAFISFLNFLLIVFCFLFLTFCPFFIANFVFSFFLLGRWWFLTVTISYSFSFFVFFSSVSLLPHSCHTCLPVRRSRRLKWASVVCLLELCWTAPSPSAWAKRPGRWCLRRAWSWKRWASLCWSLPLFLSYWNWKGHWTSSASFSTL